MRYRDNIPLAVMGLVSLGVLVLFGISEMGDAGDAAAT